MFNAIKEISESADVLAVYCKPRITFLDVTLEGALKDLISLYLQKYLKFIDGVLDVTPKEIFEGFEEAGPESLKIKATMLLGVLGVKLPQLAEGAGKFGIKRGDHMLDKAKKIIERATESTTKVSFVNFGLTDQDICTLKEFLEAKPHIIEIDLTSNSLTEESAAVLSTIKSLKRVSIGQNNFGNEGAKALLSNRNLEFINLSENGLTFEICGLLQKRRTEGVKIVTTGNPALDSNYPNTALAPILGETSAEFRIEQSVVPTAQRTSGGVIQETFFDRRRKSPEPADPKLEISLMDQFKAYLTKHPERSDKLLSELSNFCSSIKFVK